VVDGYRMNVVDAGQSREHRFSVGSGQLSREFATSEKTSSSS
jgi:hypothetical protein